MNALAAKDVLAFVAFVFALLFAGYKAVDDELVNEEYVASIIEQSRHDALAVQDHDEWKRHVNWGDEYTPQTVALKEVK